MYFRALLRPNRLIILANLPGRNKAAVDDTPLLNGTRIFEHIEHCLKGHEPICRVGDARSRCFTDERGGDNSYRNVVVACHACNSRNQALAAEEYLRLLYREGLLGQDDLRERIETIAQISAGGLIPVIGIAA